MEDQGRGRCGSGGDVRVSMQPGFLVSGEGVKIGWHGLLVARVSLQRNKIVSPIYYSGNMPPCIKRDRQECLSYPLIMRYMI